jgi:hypothetical protein
VPDAPTASRDSLVGEQSTIVNRIKATLAPRTIRGFDPKLEKARRLCRQGSGQDQHSLRAPAAPQSIALSTVAAIFEVNVESYRVRQVPPSTVISIERRSYRTSLRMHCIDENASGDVAPSLPI